MTTVASTPPNPLLTSLPRLRNLYTDATLLCNSHRFPVHRLILDAHSPDVFAKSFAGWSSDSHANELEIKDAQPDALKALLDYCYTETYDVPEYIQSCLGFRLEVYQLADRFQCLTLLAESLRRFTLACQSDAWDPSGFVKVARDIETSELGRKKGLRAVVLETMKARLETLLLSQEFAELLGECQALNVALLRSLGRDVSGVVLSKRAEKRRQKERNGPEGWSNSAGVQKSRWSSPEPGISGR